MKKSICCLLAVFFVLSFGVTSCGKTSYLEKKEGKETVLSSSGSSKRSNQKNSHAEKKTDSGSSAASDAEKKPKEETAKRPWVVHVTGAVMNPGVYHVAREARVYEAIECAGGLHPDAAPDSLNQALPVKDGQKIHVMTAEEARELAELEAVEHADGESVGRGDGKVHLNTASREQLMELPGIGESKADAILKYREEHGNFTSIEDLKKISGIKDGVIKKFGDQAVVD